MHVLHQVLLAVPVGGAYASRPIRSQKKAREKQGIKHVVSRQKFILLLESLGVTSRLFAIVAQNRKTAWQLI